MKKIWQGIKSAFVVVVSTIQGGLAGFLSTLLNHKECINVTVNGLNPAIQVDPDYSSINLTQVIAEREPGNPLSYYVNNTVFVQQLLETPF